jgi:hypothetical protein
MYCFALSTDKMLIGSENFDEWKRLVRLSAIAQGLDAYLTTDHRPLINHPSHSINMAKLSFIIENSISSHIREQLIQGGWRPDSLESLDSKALFEKIREVCA